MLIGKRQNILNYIFLSFLYSFIGRVVHASLYDSPSEAARMTLRLNSILAHASIFLMKQLSHFHSPKERGLSGASGEALLEEGHIRRKGPMAQG